MKHPTKPLREYSEEHLDYLWQQKKKTIAVASARVMILLVLLLVWELSALFEWVNPFITSSPSRIVKTIYGLWIWRNHGIRHRCHCYLFDPVLNRI